MADKENRFNRISISIASPDQIKDWAKRTSCRRRNPASDAWSCPEKDTCDCGEIKKAETINYRSFRPEHQGLFCEATFGPQKDFECSCGKYKRIKHKGLICDQCGVEVTKSQVRRERLGYIKLATPVSHIWFFKGIPSRLGTFLELASRQVERVLYFEAFIVTEVIDDSCGLAEKDILTEAEVSAKLREHPNSFRAGTGAEAIQELLRKIDLPEDVKKFTEELEATSSHQKKVKLSKQLKMVAGFDKAEMHPDWMILDVLPVISPDLRPLVSLEGGRFATSDLNDLYRRVINRNNRLQKLIDLRSPEVILRNEKRMLQESVDAFLDNGRHGRRVTGPGKRALKSLSDILKGKVGRFRQNLLGKRVDYSGRSVIVVGPELELHQCGVPKLMAVELFKPFIIEKLLTSGKVQTIKRGKYLTEHVTPDSPVWEALEEVIADHPVLLNRPPTLHRLGIQAFMPVLVEGKSIRIPPLVCKAFNADFDGDQMAVHVPLSIEARAEAKMLLLSSGNILKPSHGEPITVPELDMILGASFLTKALPEHQERAAQLHAAYTEKSEDAESNNVFASLESEAWAKRRFTSVDEVTHAHGCGTLKLHDSVLLFFKEHHEPILTTVGRVIFNEVLPHTNGTASLTWKDETTGLELPFFNEEARSRRLSQLVKRCFNELGTAETVSLLDRLQKLSFEYATRSGISPGIKDYLIPLDKTDILSEASKQIQRLSEEENLEAEELENQKIRIWYDAVEKIEETMFTELPTTETYLVEQNKEVEGFSPVHLMADSGARARKNPFIQISAIVGLKSKQSGEILSTPIQSSYREGLDVLDYFTSTYGSRKGLVDTAMKTAASGYLTRKLVDVAQDVMITEEDCGTTHGILKFTTNAGSISFKISGRVAVEPVIHPTTEETLLESDTLITPQMAEIIEIAEVPSVRVRSILTCEAEKGVCAACYGADLTSGRLANVGEAIGIIAAQSIGEPGTQLTMRTFHTGGVVEDMSERLARKILAKATGKVRFRDFIPGRTVHEKDGLWIVEQVAEHLDQPKYKVKTVQHPECKLQPDELLTEKQYQENIERFPGFEVEPIAYEVVKVTRPDVVEANGGADFPLQEGQYLTEQEYNAYFHKFSPFRCSEPHYRVKSVKHPKTSLKEGTLLTESEAETWRAEIRPFDGEWVYETKEGAILTESEYLQKQNSVKAEMKYQIQRVTHPSCPFKEGKLLSPDEESQYHMELDEPVYTVTEVSDGIDLTVDQELTAAEFRRAQETFRTFDVQRPSTQLYRVTQVMHPECPLRADELIEAEKLETLRDKFSGFTAERLKYRITAVHHPVCKLEPETLLTENEKKAVLKEFPGFEVDVTKNEEGFEVERLYRITASHHPEFPVAVDEFITQSESNRYRRNYKGFDFEKLYLHVPEGSETEETLTEADYKALVKQHRDTDAPPPNIKLVYHVLDVHHTECPFTAGQRIDEEEYKRAQRLYKGFDTERAFKVTGVSETDSEIAVGDILSDADYKKESASTSKNTYRVTKVIHPNCTLTIDQELKDWEYATALEQYAGVDIDGLIETFRIDIDIVGGGSVSHLIPAGYSVSVKDGQSVKAQHSLAELQEKTTNLDIVAGIPRVTELFEARRPKREDAAEIAEIDGHVQLTGQKAGVPQYRIVDGATKSRLYSIPDEKRRVDDGDWVKAGEPLTDGYLNPHDILAIGRTTLNGHSLEGEEALWAYLVDEVQAVYPTNNINDKHVEVIVRQMLQKIRILTVGDTKFYANDEVSRHKFHAENRRVEQDGGTPATGEPVLQSISKASLSTDSFISAASFQQTPKVLTDAAVEGQTDMLTGLKENVILGRLIPAGTGFSEWQELEVSRDAIDNPEPEELPEPVAEPELIVETVEE
ncbi:MAG: DNA-directed RNA polymerase subunit beta' [Candidatus Poribacteria bacterium]|nr:DNA-directed RNA polymerase subunit beta' [Candidatus Poribacteria bacterium]